MADNSGHNFSDRPDGGMHQTWYQGDLRASADYDAYGNRIPGSEHYRVNGQKGPQGDPMWPWYELYGPMSGFGPFGS